MANSRKWAFWIGSAAVTLPAWTMAQAAAPSVPTELASAIDKSYPGLESLYKDLHAHPEVGFQETRTAGIMAEQMHVPFLGSIPIDPLIAESGDEGKAFVESATSSPAAGAFHAMLRNALAAPPRRDVDRAAHSADRKTQEGFP